MIGREALLALLFAAAVPLSVEEIKEVFQLEEDEVSDLIDSLDSYLKDQRMGIHLSWTHEGITLETDPEFVTYIDKIRTKEEELTSVALETLAIIAFKQPVTKAEIEEIRGVSCDHVLRQLRHKELVTEVGRKDTIGKPLLFGTTDKFLRSMGVVSLNELQEQSQNIYVDDTMLLPKMQSMD